MKKTNRKLGKKYSRGVRGKTNKVKRSEIVK